MLYKTTTFCLLASATLVLANDLPAGCDLTTNPGQDATLACFEDLDRDGNAALSPAEAEVLPRIRGQFNELDSDGDGALTAGEFQGGSVTLPQKAGGKGT